MEKPIIYQAALLRLNDEEIKNVCKGQSLEDRLGAGAQCPECGQNEWFLLPKESLAVRSGGKPYCECLNCGFTTHM